MGTGGFLLKLSRRISETVKIGDDISVTVLSVNGHQVRIGVPAPRRVAVHREEVYDRIQADVVGGTNPTTET